MSCSVSLASCTPLRACTANNTAHRGASPGVGTPLPIKTRAHSLRHQKSTRRKSINEERRCRVHWFSRSGLDDSSIARASRPGEHASRWLSLLSLRPGAGLTSPKARAVGSEAPPPLTVSDSHRSDGLALKSTEPCSRTVPVNGGTAPPKLMFVLASYVLLRVLGILHAAAGLHREQHSTSVYRRRSTRCLARGRVENDRQFRVRRAAPLNSRAQRAQ